jgi:hypothetical protein
MYVSTLQRIADMPDGKRVSVSQFRWTAQARRAPRRFYGFEKGTLEGPKFESLREFECTGVPHSGHRSGEARRSYPQTAHRPWERRRALMMVLDEKQTVRRPNNEATDQYGIVILVRFPLTRVGGKFRPMNSVSFATP